MATISQTVALRLSQNALGGTTLRMPLAASVASATSTASTSTAPTSTIVSLSGATQKGTTPISYVDTIKPSGDKTIDPLLAGRNRWWHTAGADGSVPSSVARHALTYSFVSTPINADSNGFQALNASQKAVIKDAMDYISSIVDITFTETGSGGDIQLGSNYQASSAGYARYPNEGSQVMLANNQSTFSGSWARGSYEWMTIIHEISHALGLKHPGNYNAGGGGTEGPYLSKALDNRGNTVMSYNDAPTMKRIACDGHSFSTSYVTPDTYQMDDIAALQYLYGASKTTSAQTYSWADDAVISQTLWNPDANSAIDLSNQTKDNIVDLRAGHMSSIAIRDAYADMAQYFNKTTYAAVTNGSGTKIAKILGVPTYTGLNNLGIAAGSHINTAVGGSGNDTFVTNDDGDTIDGGDGNDSVFITTGDGTIDGGNGDDTVYVAKTSGTVWTLSDDHATLTQTRTDKKTNITTTLATVSLNGVEHVKYWNGKALKVTGNVNLLGSPLDRGKTLAYTTAPAPTSTFSAIA